MSTTKIKKAKNINNNLKIKFKHSVHIIFNKTKILSGQFLIKLRRLVKQYI